MTTYYEHELARLPETYSAALSASNADLAKLKSAIRSASESSLIGVGSGGSFTTASLLCHLHETYTGRVSRASTPLEIICNPTLASSSPVFLISAEGKNPDICEALQRARRHSSRRLHVLTNREDSALMSCVKSHNDVTAHVFSLAGKDGYLATNSLLLNAALFARAYTELDQAGGELPPRIEELLIGETRISEWVTSAQSFVEQVTDRGTLTVIYSPLLKPIAIDLESKLSEAALLHVQFADLRSYAHGRHLWLANRPQDCAVLALTEPSLGDLWDRTKALFPSGVPTLTMPLLGSSPRDLITGLIAQMFLVSSVANARDKDIGHPVVPQFGRDLHYIDLPSVIPIPAKHEGEVEKSKYEVLGAKWPSEIDHPSMRRARIAFEKDLICRDFRALVFDYDGTLCPSQKADSPPPKDVLDHLERLVNAGVVIGIASGRGGSVQEALSQSLPEQILNKIVLGLYNCGWISDASKPPKDGGQTSEFLSHVIRIVKPHPLFANGINFQVLVAEDADLDGHIRAEDPGSELVQLPGFTGAFHAESIKDWPLVWFPILGENRANQLEKVLSSSEIPRDAEICPVIPHPSKNPRRGDDLLIEYQTTLFKTGRTVTSNIVFVHESNPFEAYRQLLSAMKRYQHSLKVIGSCRLVVTPLGSKLITVGAGLACFEMRHANGNDDYRVAVPLAEPKRYIAQAHRLRASTPDISALLLTGEAFLSA